MNLKVSIAAGSKKYLFALVFLMLSTYYVEAQFMEGMFSPKIDVQIKHPPSLPLQTERVVFGPASGACSEEVLDGVLSDLVGHDIEVVDRQSLDLMLTEQQLSLSGRIDATTALELGKVIGPSVMLSIRVLRCAATETLSYKIVTRKDKEGNEHKVRRYQSTTTISFKASVRAIDLTTGRIFSARIFEYTPTDTNFSYAGYPIYPDELELKNQAIGATVLEVGRMFIPWVENRKLTFYKNKKCGLKKAYQALKAGSLERTFTLSKENLEYCKSASKIKPKVLSQAYYNLGMVYRILGQFELALENFKTAAEIRPGNLTQKAISNVQEAWDAERAFNKIEENVDLAFQEKKAKADVRENATLTNNDVIALAAQGLPTAVIIKLVATRPSRFDINLNALGALASAKVHESIITAMIDKASKQ